MAYVLQCNHPKIEDVGDDEDETYYQSVYHVVEHKVPAKDKKQALMWAENHARQTVSFFDKSANPKPIRLIAIIKVW